MFKGLSWVCLQLLRRLGPGVASRGWVPAPCTKHSAQVNGSPSVRAPFFPAQSPSPQHSSTLHAHTLYAPTYPACRSYIAAGFVKWIEAAGGRAVPIRFYASDRELYRIFKSINGIVFPVSIIPFPSFAALCCPMPIFLLPMLQQALPSALLARQRACLLHSQLQHPHQHITHCRSRQLACAEPLP